MIALIILQTVVIVLLGVLVAGLLRSHAEILRRLESMGSGRGDADDHGFRVQPGLATPSEGFADAADISGVTPFDEAIGITVPGAPVHTLVAFLSTGCQTCQTFWEAFAGDAVADLPPGVRLIVVTHGPESESPGAARDLARPVRSPVVMSDDAWGDYGVPNSPYFVLVDGPGGRVVGEGASTTWPQVVDLIRQAVADAPTAPEGPAGAQAPLSPGGDLLPLAASGQDRADRVDRELTAAGIHPGHPSLYGDPEAVEETP